MPARTFTHTQVNPLVNQVPAYFRNYSREVFRIRESSILRNIISGRKTKKIRARRARESIRI